MGGFLPFDLYCVLAGGDAVYGSCFGPGHTQELAGIKGFLFSELGIRFSRLGWILFPFIILTGTLALLGRGYSVKTLLSGEFWTSSVFGSRLMKKLTVFSLVLILSGIHDFWPGPKAAELMDSQPESTKTSRFRKASSWVGKNKPAAGAGYPVFCSGVGERIKN